MSDDGRDPLGWVQVGDIDEVDVVGLGDVIAAGHEQPVPVGADLRMEMRFLPGAVGGPMAGEREPFVLARGVVADQEMQVVGVGMLVLEEPQQPLGVAAGVGVAERGWQGELVALVGLGIVPPGQDAFVPSLQDFVGNPASR